MIKTIIFDLNGIFIKSPYLSDRFEEEFGVLPKDFLPALKDVLSKARLSNKAISFQYWQPYLKKWQLALSEKEFFDFWFKAEQEDPDMIKLARELKNKGLKIIILSNNFVERADYYKKLFTDISDIVDKMYYSWQTGFVKPDKRAWQNVLADNNLKAEECLYFDNSAENVAAAEELGIKAYLFESVEKTKKIIEEE